MQSYYIPSENLPKKTTKCKNTSLVGHFVSSQTFNTFVLIMIMIDGV